jgi:hypothetical protein
MPMCGPGLSRSLIGMHPFILSAVTNQLVEDRVETARRARRVSRRRLFSRGGSRGAPRVSHSPGRLRLRDAGR